MSFVGSMVIACIQPSETPMRLTSIDDLKTVTIDETTAVLVFSRNGWINNRIEELAHLEHIDLLPTSQRSQLSPIPAVSANLSMT